MSLTSKYRAKYAPRRNKHQAKLTMPPSGLDVKRLCYVIDQLAEALKDCVADPKNAEYIAEKTLNEAQESLS
jgi:hypothetical protein